ncbi:hypothetical protein L3X38_011968 [Prunus dulcis]|uniref:Uncharacterized protein n=1 Tax=Prunus dulcis TaxID=3755 RepID=A0AAD4ZFX7_PRUDU|nr:hypothetical protein L3X38_011968 [Prunus dulcis]
MYPCMPLFPHGKHERLMQPSPSSSVSLSIHSFSDTNKRVTPRTGSAVAGYCPLWAWLHSHQPARFCFWELTKQLPRVVTHPGIAPASHSLNFGVPSTPKPVSSQKASSKSEWRSGPGPTPLSTILSALGRAYPSDPHGFVSGSSRSNSPGGHPSWDCSSLQLA